MTIQYRISDTTGSTVLDGGTDLQLARRAAQSHANRTGLTTYLYEQEAPEDDYESFQPAGDLS